MTFFIKKIVLFLIALLSICGCNSPQKETSVTEEDPFIKFDTTYDDYRNHFATYSNTVKSGDKIISKPTALAFYRIYHKLDRWHKNPKDTSIHLPKRFLNPNRQEIYKTYDVSGMYGAYIEPELIKLKIPITVDTIGEFDYIVFKGKYENYRVNLNIFDSTDGVLLFHPDRKPILWTNNWKGNPSKTVNCYFTGCP